MYFGHTNFTFTALRGGVEAIDTDQYVPIYGVLGLMSASNIDLIKNEKNKYIYIENVGDVRCLHRVPRVCLPDARERYGTDSH